VSLLRAFVAHEAITQFRSTRFRVLGGVYVLASCAPAIVVFLMARRAPYLIGSATYAQLIDLAQPLFTTLFAGLVSVDAISREREEGSFAVVSLAPLSASGYLLRRWIAVVAMILPLTIVPRLAGAALAAVQTKQVPMLAAFAGGWALKVLPVLLIVSAIALALGTINGSTILSIIVALLLATAGLDFVNDIAAHWHRRFEGPSALVAFNPNVVQRLSWSLRGYYSPILPTEAAYPLAAGMRRALWENALIAAFAFLLLAVSMIFLRRTRRDLRPWRPKPDHQLRSLIRLANRIRSEYSPDGSIGTAEWLMLGCGLLVLAGTFAVLEGRIRRFERFGAERYAAYTESRPLPMTPDVVPLAARLRGSLSRDGRVQSHSQLTLRNNGTSPVSHLGFSLSPLVRLTSLQASRGRARVARLWRRVGIDLDPPLDSGESRTLTFDVDGTPGDVDIPLPWSGGIVTKWRRYVHAEKSFDLTDLSQSAIVHDIDEAHIALGAEDLMLVPRYTAWVVDKDTDLFARESIEPPAALDLVLTQPFAAAADSCGHLAIGGQALVSRCSMTLASYGIAGGPLATSSIGPGISLAYIPAHASLARVHGPALAGAVTRAEQAWSGLSLTRPIAYVEAATSADEARTPWEWREMHTVRGSGRLQLVPENLFTRFAAIDEGAAAVSLIVNALRARRTVVAAEADFFRIFYHLTVTRRVRSGENVRAVVPAIGNPPLRAALLSPNGDGRIPFVTATIEARAGAAHVVEGINDFAAAGPRPGTARELLAAIGRRAGLDLSRTYDDYFVDAKVPRLTFEGVTFRRNGASWDVRGTLYNEGTGQAFCPIALRTAGASLFQTLRIDSGERVAFTFTTPAEPHTLQLDPDRVCYREAYVGAVESVDYKGES
jgi:hypothetical protein